MALRVASPAHLIDINGIDELSRLTFEQRRPSCSRSVRASCHVPAARRAWPLGASAEQGRPLHRALPDPDPGHDVWQPGERRSRVGVVPGCGDPGRGAHRNQQPGTRSHPSVRLVPRSDDYRTSTRRAPAAGAVPGHFRRIPFSGSRSSADAPAISPWPWLWSRSVCNPDSLRSHA